MLLNYEHVIMHTSFLITSVQQAGLYTNSSSVHLNFQCEDHHWKVQESQQRQLEDRPSCRSQCAGKIKSIFLSIFTGLAWRNLWMQVTSTFPCTYWSSLEKTFRQGILSREFEHIRQWLLHWSSMGYLRILSLVQRIIVEFSYGPIYNVAEFDASGAGMWEKC
jgi:hypothetical protein